MTVTESRFSPSSGSAASSASGAASGSRREREQQRGEVREVATVERRRVVAALERRSARGSEVGHDGEGRDERCASRDHCDRRAGSRSPVSHGVPHAHRRDDETHVLLRRDRQGREERERPQPALVEVPPREQEQRAGERNGVEVAHRQPLHRRQEEVRDRERRRGPARADVLARRARRPGVPRSRRRPPGPRAAARGSARTTRGARTGRGSGRSASRAGRSARRGRP